MKFIIGLILSALICVTSLLVLSGDEGEIYLIPSNYKGTVVVFFNRPNGKPEEFEKNKRVYTINENGVLETKFSERKMYLKLKNIKFYYYDKNTKERKELRYYESNIDNSENYIKDSVYIFSLRNETGLSNKNYSQYSYTHFIVGTLRNKDSLFAVREKQHLPDLLD